jgi:cytochrome c
MNKLLKAIFCLLALVGAAAANAAVDTAAAEATAKKLKCTKCHKEADRPNPKKDGPSMKDIAAKYKNDPAAIGTLAKKVMTAGGEKGHEHPELDASPSEAEVKQVLEWYMTK